MQTTSLAIDSAIREQLQTLDAAVDKEKVKTVFTRLMQEHGDKNYGILDINIEVLRCRSKRCVLRYCIDAFDIDLQQEFTWRVIGKVLRPEVGEEIFAKMQQLWAHGFARGSQDGISMPEPLGYIPSLCLLLQEEVLGTPLKELFKQGIIEKEHSQHLARTLVKLHTLPMMPGRLFTVRDHLARCHPKYEFLSLACPELTHAVYHIVDKAYGIELEFGDIQRAAIHGDFHPGQVHMQNGYAWLIDFDTLNHSDPAADLGNLLVFLKSKARKSPVILEFIQTLIEEYFSVMDRQIAERLPMYEGLTYLRRACKCLRLQKEGWRQRARQLVESGVASIDTIETMVSPMPVADLPS
jgi:hypothetical protein